MPGAAPDCWGCQRRGDEARREDDEVARQVAAAAAGAREEARREAEEETARQVAAAVEAALREAKDETARQVAEAVAHARQEAAEAARQGGVIAEPAPEQPREPELEEPAPPVAATLGEARPRASGKTDMEPAGKRLDERLRLPKRRAKTPDRKRARRRREASLPLRSSQRTQLDRRSTLVRADRGRDAAG